MGKPLIILYNRFLSYYEKQEKDFHIESRKNGESSFTFQIKRHFRQYKFPVRKTSQNQV